MREYIGCTTPDPIAAIQPIRMKIHSGAFIDNIRRIDATGISSCTCREPHKTYMIKH